MRTPEQRQREHELYEAYKAARLLEERLEMCGGFVDQRDRARRIRDDLAAELIVVGRPMPDFGA